MYELSAGYCISRKREKVIGNELFCQFISSSIFILSDLIYLIRSGLERSEMPTHSRREFPTDEEKRG